MWDDYEKSRYHWKYLNVKLKREGNQLGSVTTQFKFAAPDGKSKSKAYAPFDSSFMEHDLTDIFLSSYLRLTGYCERRYDNSGV